MTDLLDRVDAEIAAGRRWRAKEILRGNLARSWPEAAVVERYGRLLIESGDQVDAGRYLFLSGVRRPEYEDAIALFLARHGRAGGGSLLTQLPRSFKRLPFSDLPPVVREELSARGVTPAALGSRSRREPESGWKASDILIPVIVLAMLMCLVLGIWVAFQSVVQWTMGLVR